ncbi:hypothetical protein J2S72_001412 [Peptoniphilus koenoeneniae]|uniref:Uncharacterized protein n=1 Tax=Peptoniphilus koenoeneniae TaxID=507751 RepID=A0ABU0AWJ0_9FIRM|nr:MULTISPECIES: hypothetical protein [Peptoniphilus]ERT57961.1 hypothetical protein HMPREF1253_0429 [Peptoniphilus sp. BV3C26]MDQ0275385.1 hypothetical protein [Peptoniphilus koenoeneniae]
MKKLRCDVSKTLEGKNIIKRKILPELNPGSEGSLQGFLTLLKQLYTGKEVSLYTVEEVKIG